MNPLSIIKQKIDPMGYPISPRELAQLAVKRVQKGWDTTFTYGRVVFTVSREGIVHLYALDSGSQLLPSAARFMRDVWKKGTWTRLSAPIKDERVMRLAERFGWKPNQADSFGFIWYHISRE